MTDFYQFADHHPLLAFCAIVFAYLVIRLLFWFFNRCLRSRNIAEHGWPPAPMDADGDVVHPEKPS